MGREKVRGEGVERVILAKIPDLMFSSLCVMMMMTLCHWHGNQCRYQQDDHHHFCYCCHQIYPVVAAALLGGTFRPYHPTGCQRELVWVASRRN